MEKEQNDFQTWFVTPMKHLRNSKNPENTCFIFAMVGFPLLERYLREKSKCYEADLNDDFYKELGIIFPEIKDCGRNFYSAYRNGLLHQVTFASKKLKKKKDIWVKLPKAAISGHNVKPIYPHENGTFYMNPFTFYDRVVDIVLNDFKTYLGASSIHHSLPAYEDFSTADLGVTATISQTLK